MKIRIGRLTLDNFKCHKHLELRFGGGDASIYGDNAAGKTSVYDALMWLLFGKDSQGNGEKNMEIKPLDSDGNVIDHEAVTGVEAELLVGEMPMVLRRTFREVWATRRGSSEAVFDGNTSEYYIDGVPHKKNVFDERIRELVSEELFRLLTSVSYFAKDMSWQKRREVLFDMAGTMTDQQIMQTSEEYRPLLEAMGRLGLEDYKRKLLKERKDLTSAKSEIPARISECQKTIEDLEGLDFQEAKRELAALEARKERYSERILALENDTATASKRLEIREAQMELTALEQENEAFRKSQAGPEAALASAKAEARELTGRMDRSRALIGNDEALISHLDEKIEGSRQMWMRINGEVFSGGICDACGQKLPTDKLQAAMDRFEDRRRERLTHIEQSAGDLKAAKEQAEDRIAGYREELSELEARLTGARERLAALESGVPAIHDMEDYVDRKRAIQGRIVALDEELAKLTENVFSIKADLQRQAEEIRRQIRAASEVIGKEAMLGYARERIGKLRQDAKNGAECLEAVERMLFLIEGYTRYKTRFVEDSINRLFRLARFRLYREQANGGVEDRCDVVYDGVPYLGLNNGMKINVGIDIINALSRHHGVTVPLFIDNAESVTRLEDADAQVIRLVVSAGDKELRCTNEN